MTEPSYEPVDERALPRFPRVALDPRGTANDGAPFNYFPPEEPAKAKPKQASKEQDKYGKHQ